MCFRLGIAFAILGEGVGKAMLEFRISFGIFRIMAEMVTKIQSLPDGVARGSKMIMMGADTAGDFSADEDDMS